MIQVHISVEPVSRVRDLISPHQLKMMKPNINVLPMHTSALLGGMVHFSPKYSIAYEKVRMLMFNDMKNKFF